MHVCNKVHEWPSCTVTKRNICYMLVKGVLVTQKHTCAHADDVKLLDLVYSIRIIDKTLGIEPLQTYVPTILPNAIFYFY